jgi:hypothetical protein
MAGIRGDVFGWLPCERGLDRFDTLTEALPLFGGVGSRAAATVEAFLGLFVLFLTRLLLVAADRKVLLIIIGGTVKGADIVNRLEQQLLY